MLGLTDEIGISSQLHFQHLSLAQIALQLLGVVAKVLDLVLTETKLAVELLHLLRECLEFRLFFSFQCLYLFLSLKGGHLKKQSLVLIVLISEFALELESRCVPGFLVVTQ